MTVEMETESEYTTMYTKSSTCLNDRQQTLIVYWQELWNDIKYFLLNIEGVHDFIDEIVLLIHKHPYFAISAAIFILFPFTGLFLMIFNGIEGPLITIPLFGCLGVILIVSLLSERDFK